MHTPSEPTPEHVEAEPITPQRIAQVCQKLLVNTLGEAYRLTEEDMLKFEALSFEEACFHALSELQSVDFENPKEALRKYGIE